MRELWAYPLPTGEKSRDYQYESPIFPCGDEILFVSSCGGNDLLHIVNGETGQGRTLQLSRSVSVLPKRFFFRPLPHGILIYNGDFSLYRDGGILKTFEMNNFGDVTSHLLLKNRLYLVCGQHGRSTLLAFDTDRFMILWTVDVSCKSYAAGPVTEFEGQLSCFGKDKLLFLNPMTGEVLRELTAPRTGKLFSPKRSEDGNLILGYTNWSNAGLMKLHPLTGKPIWKHRRSFEGPLLRCRWWQKGDMLWWVKNDRELICLDAATGEERYAHPTQPWLYTDLYLMGERLLFGTAGADGYLICLHAETGEEAWSLPLQNGCEYYGLLDETVIVGDFSKRLMQLSLRDGSVLQELPMAGEIVGRITICDGCACTVVWGNGNRPITLVKTEI